MQCPGMHAPIGLESFVPQVVEVPRHRGAARQDRRHERRYSLQLTAECFVSTVVMGLLAARQAEMAEAVVSWSRLRSRIAIIEAKEDGVSFAGQMYSGEHGRKLKALDVAARLEDQSTRASQ